MTRFDQLLWKETDNFSAAPDQERNWKMLMWNCTVIPNPGGEKQKTPAALPEISLLKTSGLKSANKPYSSSNQTFQGWRSHKNMGIDQKQQQCPCVSYSSFTSLKGTQVIVTLCESRAECGSQAYTTEVTYMTFTLHYTDNGKELELWRYWKSYKLGNYIKKQNKKTQIHHLLECSQGYNCSYNFQIPRKDKCFPK